METPSLAHISFEDYLHVYEPAEDSFLMIDALEKDKDVIAGLDPTFCLEVGSGSGVVITAFSMAFPRCFCVSTDINSKACKVTVSTSRANDATVDAVNMDLATCFKSKLFDVIIFNPPYVVTDSLEIGHSDISRSWAGGVNGREVVDRLLPAVSCLLSEKGAFYVLLIKENVPEEVKVFMQDNGFKSDCILSRRARNEHQAIFKFTKL